jgi:hypothetical protein
MIWLSPWAWIGASAIALPILIHLLGRGHARALRFPTLRFLEASRLLPTRRTRVHDLVLLVLRCSAIVVAAAALARPLILTQQRKQSLDPALARAIVVDTSASMRRLMPSGMSALDSARRDARSIAAGAASSTIVESSDPSRAIASANEWLARQGMRGELIVLSDFQNGIVDSADFNVVKKEFGISLRRIPVEAANSAETRAASRGIDIIARGTLVGDRTDAEWLARAASSSSNAVVLLGGDADRDAVRATQEAAQTIAVPLPVDTTRRISFVFSSYPDASKLKAAATTVYSAWMVDVLARLRQDSMGVRSSGVGDVGGRPRLMLFTELAPGTSAAAHLVAAANQALSIADPENQLGPGIISDKTLAAMQRPALDDVPSQRRRIGANGPSDGRWLWLVVLALLGIETVLRKSKTTSLTGVVNAG